jgi:hypothetical protein
MSKEAFWKEVKKITKDNEMDEILSYMFLLIKKAKEKEISCRKENFKKHGDITLGKRAIKIISNSDSCIFFRHDDLLQFAYAICTSIIVFFFRNAFFAATITGSYDFDGTLAKGNIQENSFIPELDMSKEAFWIFGA